MANAAFLLDQRLGGRSARLRRRWEVDRFLVLMAGTVWVSSILQTLVDHGDNPRFLVPLQMFVVTTVLIVIQRELIVRRREPRGS